MSKEMNINDETLSLQEFKRYLSHFAATIFKIVLTTDVSEKELYNKKSYKCLMYLQQNFTDIDANLIRWLYGMPCVYRHPIAKKKVSVKIPVRNIDAIYYFLRFCMKINRFQWVDEDLKAYVIYLLNDSCEEDRV